MTSSKQPSDVHRRARLICRSCSALPDDNAVMGGRCPWCRGQLSREFGPVIARCVECGMRGTVGAELGVRDYAKGSFIVPRAVCGDHVRPDRPPTGMEPTEKLAAP